MPCPTNAPEVKQFLPVTVHYRKFIPYFARPLPTLSRKDMLFAWKTKDQDSFYLIKQVLMEEPILQYPD